MAPVLIEVFRAHAAIAAGRAPELPPPPRPYREYIAWLRGLDCEASRAYFHALLAGKSAPTPLPLAEPAARPLVRRGYGHAYYPVEESAAARARETARRAGITMGALVHAAWALVLARTTGQEDVLFGSTRACRRSALGGEADHMIGLFINTLPMRLQVRDEDSVADLLSASRAQGLALRDHEHTPLVDVQGASEIPRGVALFETLLMFENRSLDGALRAADPAWQRRSCTLHEQPSPPLCATVTDDSSLAIRLLYDRRRFHDAAAARLAGYLAQAITELGRGEHRIVGDLDILPAEERRRVLLTWNDTARPFPSNVLLHEPFEDRVRESPGAVAVERDGDSRTYAQLDERANRIARALVDRGVGPGAYVGVCLDRGIDLVAALLAVVKAGAAYVPLDPRYPRDRLAFMTEDARVPLVITETRHRGLFTVPALVLDGEDAAVLAHLPADRLPRRASPGDPCYAIYTSGSTGKPKGVVLTHAAVMNTLDWVTRTFRVGQGDRLLFVTSPCFDLSVYDTFGALGAGATVVIASGALLDDPAALAAAIAERRITIWDSAPASLTRLVPYFPRNAQSPLRLVMLSGDWIPLSLPDEVRSAFPRARVVSLGGATEAAIWSNWFDVGAIDPRWTSIPYGRPIQNARYHVLDARMRPVPIGATGELYIGGTCLARGYLHREELTAARFVRDPLHDDPGERLYRTGDLARYGDDGVLALLGRADLQVKIRGYRVELGEVEAALSAAPGVLTAVCDARRDPSGQRSLVGYVVPRTGAAIDTDEVRSFTASRLAEFMVPAQIVVLDAMPLSANGKVARDKLPDPAARTPGEEYVAPRTPLERRIAAVWEEVLGRDRVGVTDGFFALGGHSLSAVTLVTRLERELSMSLPLSRLLEKPTIEALAASIEARAPLSRRGPHVVTLSRRASRPPLVLVAGAGGFGFVFRGLSQHLSGTHAVHVLNAVGADDPHEQRHRTIEEMAAIYLPEVLAACPDGPILVGGYSFGVLVAFELANRLRAIGRAAPLLVSFDGFAPRFPELLPLGERIASYGRALLDHEGRGLIRSRFSRMGARIRARADDLLERLPSRAGAAEDGTFRRLRRLEETLWGARDTYRPEHVWEGDLLLLRSVEEERWLGSRMNDPLYGWRSYASGSIDVVSLPGAHLTLFDDQNQKQMAEAILAATARLDRAEDEARPLAS